MIEYLHSLFSKYQRRGIIIDTNILLLFFVGKLDKNIIPKFKRTATFTIADYEALEIILKKFKTILTTPNILTEVMNLANQIPNSEKPTSYKLFSGTIEILEEKYVESKILAGREEFSRFGLTDAGISALATEDYLVLSDDFRLTQYLTEKKIPAVNFNHLRLHFMR